MGLGCILVKSFRVAAGQSVFSPGQECPGFLILNKGSIRVTLAGASGREMVLYRVRPGEVCLQTFTCLVDGKTYSAEGIVESDLEGEMIPPSEFHQRLDDDTDFRRSVLASVALRFSEYQNLVEDVALTAFDTRLAKTLLKLVDDDGLVRASHASLASETASGRAYVTRRLAEFARRGLVEQRTNGIYIARKRDLERFVVEAR